MASTANKLVQLWLAPAMKAARFTKAGATWRRLRQPFIHVFNIQGSQWSRFFYFNLGVYITDIGTSDRPSEAHCHIRERLDSIVPDRERFIRLSDFEQDIPEHERRRELQAFIASYAIPWLDRMSSTEQLRNYILTEKKHGLPVAVSTYEYLKIQKPNTALEPTPTAH